MERRSSFCPVKSASKASQSLVVAVDTTTDDMMMTGENLAASFKSLNVHFPMERKSSTVTAQSKRR
jgi:hypothetical protein